MPWQNWPAKMPQTCWKCSTAEDRPAACYKKDLDEALGPYKNIETVMANQSDLLDVAAAGRSQWLTI